MQIYSSNPYSIGKNRVIDNTELISKHRMFLAISPKTNFYSTLSNEMGMFLVKVNDNKLTFRSQESMKCGEFGQNHLDLNLYWDSKKDRVDADLGLFRLVCSNGLERFEKMTGVRFDNVMANKINPLILTESLNLKIPTITNRINKIQSVEIDSSIKDEIVNDFLVGLNSDSTRSYLKNKDHMKFGDINTMIRLISETDLLNPNRVEDYGNNLWTTYNTVQENAIKVVKSFKPSTMIENKLLLDVIKPIYA